MPGNNARMSDVTRILNALEQADESAAGELLPLVYAELRRLAAQKLARESPGQTLEATALVHEAYLRLVGEADPGWRSRGHFFAAAAEAMRRILIDTQNKDGCSAGSWDPKKPTKDAWGEPGGRLMMTSLSCLTLEVYYRYLPLYKLDQDGKKAAMEEL